MAFPYGVFKTYVTGEILTASDLNSTDVNHINNNIPESMDDYSTNATEMQSVADPYPGSSESLPTTLAGELERIRYQLKAILGETHWYYDSATTLNLIDSVKASLDQADTPADTATDIKDRLDQIVSQLKLITGGANWYTAPAATISALDSQQTTNTTSITNLQSNMANILVNGGMEVWQRGTAFANPALDVYTADKWQVSKTGTMTYDVDREATSVDVGNYSMKIDVTAAPTPGVLRVYQTIERVKDYRGETVTLSARIYSTVSGPTVAINDTSGTSTSSAHTGGGWETLSVSRTLGGSITSLTIRLGWNTNASVSTIYIDSAMLVIGDAAVSFVPEDPSLELRRCQRYYEKRSGVRGYIPMVTAGAANFFRVPVQFSVVKSGIPTITITKNTVTTFQDPVDGSGSTADTANWALTAQSTTDDGLHVLGTRTGADATRSLADYDFDWEAVS